MDVTSENDVQAPRRSTPPTTFGHLDIMVCNAGFGYYGTVEDTPTDDHAAHDGRELHGHVLRCPRGAAHLSRAAARPPDHRVVHRRPARHRADERLQRHEGGAGRVRRVAARRSSTEPASTSASCSRCRRRPSSVRRWSATTATPFRVSGRNRRSTTWRGRLSRACEGRGPRYIRTQSARALADRQRRRTGPDRQDRAQGTVAAARAAGCRPAATGRRAPSFDRSPMAIAHAVARRRRPCGHRRRLGARSADGAPVARTSISRSTACRADRLKALLASVRPRQHRRRELHRLQGRRCRRRAAPPRVEASAAGIEAFEVTGDPASRSPRPRGGATSPSTRSPGIRSPASTSIPFNGRARHRSAGYSARLTSATFGEDRLRVLRADAVRRAFRVCARSSDA